MRVLALLSLLLLFTPVHPACAQDQIRHCVASDGTPVFTDQSCASMDARPPPARQPSPALGRHGFAPAHCPASARELEHRIKDAFARHDPNALAGLMLWDGYGQATATLDVRDLQRWVDKPLLGIGEGPPITFPPGAASNIAPPDARNPRQSIPGSLTLHLAGPNDTDTQDPSFPVTGYAGCLWLSP